MNTLNLLEEAINKHNTIEFLYDKKGVFTKRIGHPYVLYIYTTKDGKTSTKLGYVQIDGESESKDTKPFPSFRDYIGIENIHELKILEEFSAFHEPYHEHYNPESERYKNLINKI